MTNGHDILELVGFDLKTVELLLTIRIEIEIC